MENIYLPWLSEKVSLPDDMMISDLSAKMDQLDNYESKLDNSGSGASQAQVNAFRNLIYEVVVAMNERMAKQEQIIPELLRTSAYSKEEHDEIQQNMRDARGLIGDMRILPGIMYLGNAWAGNQLDEILLQATWPKDVQQMMDDHWMPQWKIFCLQVLYALAKEGEEPHTHYFLRDCPAPFCLCPCQPNLEGCLSVANVCGPAGVEWPVGLGLCGAICYRKAVPPTGGPVSCLSDMLWQAGVWIGYYDE